MQTLTETTEINIFLHPDNLGVMWPADARAFSLPNSRKGPGIEVALLAVEFSPEILRQWLVFTVISLNLTTFEAFVPF